MTVLLDGLVIAAAAASLAWEYHHVTARDRMIHAQYTAVRAALRTHGIDVHEPETEAPVPAVEPRPHGAAPRHRKAVQ